MRLVSESRLMKTFLSRGIEFNLAHLLSMEAVILLLEDESLPIDSVINQLLERELSKVT